MPSQAFDTGWEFGPVISLIDSDLQITSPSHSPASQAVVPIQIDKHTKDRSDDGGLQLGNFGKLFKELGFRDDEPPAPVSPVNPNLEEPSSPEDAAVVPSFARDKPVEAASGDAGPTCSQSEDTDLGQNLLAGVTGISNRQTRKQARKQAKKERKAQEKLEQEQELSTRQQVRKALEVLADSLPDAPDELSPTQPRYPLRSNVGAKIRPATPVQVDRPVNLPKWPGPPTKQETATAKPNLSPVRRPALVTSHAWNSLAQPFTPALAQTETVSCQSAPFVGCEPPNQFMTYGTPTPLQHAPSQTQFDPAKYFTPQAAGPPGYGNGLIPRTVQPVIHQRSPQAVAISQPAQHPVIPGRGPRSIIIRPQVDRHINFLSQLMYNFPEDKKWLVSPMQLCNEKLATEGIHVFVDASNIMIGFSDVLRRNGVQPFHLSFDSLALLMERRRPVAKRVSASSHREAAPLPHVTKLVDTSKAVGYENNVKEQVFIRREESERKKFFKEVDRIGWYKANQRRSGNGSESDSEMNSAVPKTPPTPKWVEQGVDEILHLKMCQSIIDSEVPTTMVLATGDGAEAEHSDGFLAHVERALKKGWKVELLSWRQQISGGYKNKKFRSKWSGKFRVIELDDYLESLIDTP